MRTTEVQVDITDPEGILGVLRSIQTELNELEIRGRQIKELNANRGEKVDKCTNFSNQVSEQLTDLLCHAETMETVIHEDSMALCSSYRDIDQLLSVQERLESMKNGEIEEVTDSDLDNEQRLIGFVADELSSKIEELSKFRHRLTDANDAYKYEWDQFRNEIRQYNTKTLGLETTVDHLQELHLARFAGEETATDDDSELLFRLVAHHMNQVTHRKLQRELAELQIKQKDLDDEIGTLITQKQSLWQRYLEIEKRMDGKTADTLEDKHEIAVKPTAAFSNLLDVIDGKFHPSMTHDLEQTEEEEKHGLYLHKCITDINVKLNFSDDESDSDADGDKAEKVCDEKIWNAATGSGGNDDVNDESDDESTTLPVVRNKIFDHMEEVPAEITKLRMRQNAGRRASLSHRNKPVTTNTIIVSDSFKSFMPSGIFKKRRASHF